jgi:hypothetical protein
VEVTPINDPGPTGLDSPPSLLDPVGGDSLGGDLGGSDLGGGFSGGDGGGGGGE